MPNPALAGLILEIPHLFQGLKFSHSLISKKLSLFVRDTSQDREKSDSPEYLGVYIVVSKNQFIQRRVQ